MKEDLFTTDKLKIRVINSNTQYEMKTTNTSYPIRMCLDNLDSFKIDNDAKQDEVNKINTTNELVQEKIIMENELDKSIPEERLKILEINKKVKHKEQNLTGKIDFIGKKKITVAWDNGYLERISLSDFDDELEIIEELEPEKEITSEIIEESNEIEEISGEEKLDEDIKRKAAQELIDLMKEKNFIQDDWEEEKYLNKILKMNDKEYTEFKNNTLKRKPEVKLTEAELELRRIRKGIKKKTGIQPVSIDEDFDSDIASDSGTRQLSKNNVLDNIKNNLNNASNLNIEGELDLSFLNMNNTNEKSNKNNMNKQAEKKLNMNNFKDLQGITKPIQIPLEEKSLKDMFGSLNWTI